MFTIERGLRPYGVACTTPPYRELPLSKKAESLVNRHPYGPECSAVAFSIELDSLKSMRIKLHELAALWNAHTEKPSRRKVLLQLISNML